MEQATEVKKEKKLVLPVGNVPLLKEFDQVRIKHHNPLDENNNQIREAYRATHVALVKGNEVFIGISRVNPKDQFVKAFGREVAIGRAMQLWKEKAGVAPVRKPSRASRYHNSYVKSFATQEQLETILLTEVYDGLVEVKEVSQDAPTDLSGSKCCGGGCGC
jgi:hypothetical protein